MQKLCLAVLAALLCVGVGQAGVLTFAGPLTNAGENSNSPGTGSATVTWDTVLNTMTVDVSFSGLVGTTTASHIHCCTATPGTGSAGVATTTPSFPGFPSGVTSGTYHRIFDLTDIATYNTNNPLFTGTALQNAATLLAGLQADEAYLNIHSSVFGGGEIRAFLVAVPEPGSIALACGALGLLWLRRRARVL